MANNEILAPLPVLQFFDNTGLPLSGGLLFAYLAGTTTKTSTFTDSTGATSNFNPITLNARGECNCWIPPNVGVKLVLSPAGDTDPPTNPFWTVDNINAPVGTPLFNGQCRLVFTSGTQTTLQPYGGNNIVIQGVTYPIGAAGIGAANTGVYVGGVQNQNLAASTLYYVYLFNNGGVPTIDFWTTGHITDSTLGNVGVEVRSNSGQPDSTRTLVGAVFTNPSAQFVDVPNFRGIASWFNRRSRSMAAAPGLVSGYNTSGGIGSQGGWQITFLCWEEDIFASVSGYAAPPATASDELEVGLGLDSFVTFNFGQLNAVQFATQPTFLPVSSSASGTPGEGKHLLSANALTSSTAQWGLNVSVNGITRI